MSDLDIARIVVMLVGAAFFVLMAFHDEIYDLLAKVKRIFK
jgi:hypothetical protein